MFFTRSLTNSNISHEPDLANGPLFAESQLIVNKLNKNFQANSTNVIYAD